MSISITRKKLDKLFDAAWNYKRLLGIGTDVILILLALFLAYLIRLGTIAEIAEKYPYQILLLAVIIVPIKILLFWVFRLYHISFRFISLSEVIAILKASAISSPMIAVIALVFRDKEILLGFPRSVIFIDFFLTFFLITGIRAFFRLYYSESNRKRGIETLVVGAGAAGEQLVRDMVRSQQHGYLPVGFVDDNPKKRNSLIHGVRVLGGSKAIPGLVRDLGVKEIIIAIPSATKTEIRDIMDSIRKSDLRDVKVLPGISDLMNGNVTLKDIRDISIEDLLGREPVKIDMENVSAYISGQNILVTGGGGSIGSELVKQMLTFDVASIRIFSRNENNQYQLSERLKDNRLRFLLGDIRDRDRLMLACEGVDIIYHAAALKHVPLCGHKMGVMSLLQ